MSSCASLSIPQMPLVKVADCPNHAFHDMGSKQDPTIEPLQLGTRTEGCKYAHHWSGRGVASLVHADDVVLLFWTFTRCQTLLNDMHSFCQACGLTISPSKTEVVVCTGSGMWHAWQHVWPQSAHLPACMHGPTEDLPFLVKLLLNLPLFELLWNPCCGAPSSSSQVQKYWVSAKVPA